MTVQLVQDQQVQRYPWLAEEHERFDHYKTLDADTLKAAVCELAREYAHEVNTDADRLRARDFAMGERQHRVRYRGSYHRMVEQILAKRAVEVNGQGRVAQLAHLCGFGDYYVERLLAAEEVAA
jgi:hypothetical protein